MHLSMPFAAALAGATGAITGYGLFGPAGALACAAAAAALTLGLARLPRSLTGLGTTGTLLVAALALYACSGLAWGGAESLDGTRFQASPAGLARVLTLDGPMSSIAGCGWHPAARFATPCVVAEAGESAYGRLRAVYPLVWIAAVCCLVGAFAALLPSGRWPALLPLSAATGALLALVAWGLFATSLGPALEALRGLAPATGGTLGALALSAGILLSLGAGLASLTAAGGARAE